ncbi:MAG TPA: polysaccharide deacetylase family protein [Firmicutes bacterium]|nr:polysaccharide deacetylase family protein [Bacillota bacterium]
MRVFVLRVKWWYLVFIVLIAFLSLIPQVREPLLVTVTSRGRLIPIYSVKTDAKKIAISFDATWGTDLTDEILAILREHDITTTFFLAGYWIDKYPDYVNKIAAAGHEIGNHSYSHPHFNSLSEAGIAYELQKTENMIQDLTGQRTNLFRPPFGEYSNKVISQAASLGYYTIQWSVDSLDWKNLGSSEIYQRIMGQIKPGDIVLFHNAAPGTPGAIKRLIPDLQARGYEIVPVSELIYKEDYYIDHTGMQHPKKGGRL